MKKEEIASPEENMNKFNLNQPKKTEIRTEAKVDDKTVYDTKDVIYT